MITHIFPKNRQFFTKSNMHFKSSCFGILFWCLAVPSGSFGQERFKQSLASKNDSIIEIYNQKNKYKYLSLIPSVSYDALNNSVNVGLNLSNLSNYFQQRHRAKIETERLKVQLEEKAQRELEKLETEIEDFRINFLILENRINLFSIDSDLYKIQKGKYENAEITIEDFLVKKKSFLSAREELKIEVLKLQNKASIISKKTKSDTLTVSLDILSNSINLYND